MNSRTRAQAEPRTLERVLILLANPTNRALLSAMLGDRYLVYQELSEIDTSSDEGPFDLCIIDSASVHRYGKALLAMRRRLQPLLVPVLILADRRDTANLTREMWEVADEVLLRPVERTELVLRVQSLLRLRAMSVDLHRLTNEFQHERRIAQRLQDAAMPKVIGVPGLRIHAAYRPGSNDATVGGDWYDVFRLVDGRLVFSVGDVAGFGLDAAVTMTSVRQVLRGVANLHADPAMMLDAADRAMNASESELVVTAFVAVFDVVDCELRYASAGHPWPFLRRSDGVVTQLGSSGTPLGLPWQIRHATESCVLHDGDLLVMYTDGLTEFRRDVVEAEARLARVLEAPNFVQATDVARTIFDQMIAGDIRDDIAIATVHLVDSSAHVHRWPIDSGNAAATKDAQRELLQRLHEHGFPPALDWIAQTVLAELVGNVVRHAPGEAMLALDCRTPAPVIHLLDRGAGFRFAPRLPEDVHAESGRGLYIVAALANDFTMEKRRNGGSHARVVLPMELSGPFASLGTPGDSVAML